MPHYQVGFFRPKASNEQRDVRIQSTYLYPNPNYGVAYSSVESSPTTKLRDSKDALVGILAHKFSHLRSINPLATMDERRQQEYDADESAARFLAQSGCQIEPLIKYYAKHDYPAEQYGTPAERANHLRNVYYSNRFPTVNPFSFYAMSVPTLTSQPISATPFPSLTRS